MSKKVYIFLADGFEDIEGLTDHHSPWNYHADRYHLL